MQMARERLRRGERERTARAMIEKQWITAAAEHSTRLEGEEREWS